jgi:hypothetical protein
MIRMKKGISRRLFFPNRRSSVEMPALKAPDSVMTRI